MTGTGDTEIGYLCEGWCNLSDVVVVLENQSLSVAGVRMGTRMVVVRYVKTLHSGLLVLCQVEI